MQSLAIIVVSVFTAVTYGVIHDQITARVCVEYFTIGHPPLFTFETHDPTLLAFGWGVVATWWVGLLLGIPLAIAARVGKREPISVRQLYRPLVILMAAAAGSALLCGVLGHQLARRDIVVLLEPLASRVPMGKHDVFLADLWAHSASYGIGFLGGIIMIVRTWRARRGTETDFG
jgi:hypothetical protein